MSTITTIASWDAISASRSVINTNFSNLNADKAELSWAIFTGDVNVPDEVYGSWWNGSTEVPTKNALYDKIETISGGGVSDWDKGDITVSSSGTVWIIDNGAVTEAKQTLSDNTTNDFSTTKHGYVPKWTNVGDFLKDDWTWASIPWGGDALTSNPLSQFASTTSSQLRGVLSDETWTGVAVFNDSPTITSPNITHEVISSNKTAVNGGEYVVVASATFTDPSPTEWLWFRVVVRNGTATVWGTGYSVAWSEIVRVFHSGAWATYLKTPSSGVNTGDQTSIVGITGTFAQFNTAVTDADLARTDSANTFTGTQTITQIDLGNTDTSITRVSAGKIAVESVNVWTEGILQNSQSTAYTLVLTDAWKHILHPSADTTARTWTIPANSSVAFPVGTAVTFVNQNWAWTLTIAITTDTMRLAWAGTTGSRTLTANGIATALKINTTEWIISWPNLT